MFNPMIQSSAHAYLTVTTYTLHCTQPDTEPNQTKTPSNTWYQPSYIVCLARLPIFLLALLKYETHSKGKSSFFM